MDLLVFGYDTRKQLQLYEKVYDMVASGEIPEERIDRAVTRILALKRAMEQRHAAASAMLQQEQAQSLLTLSRQVIQIYGDAALLPAVRQAARQGITNAVVAGGSLHNVPVPDGMRVAECEDLAEAIAMALPDKSLPGRDD